MEAKNQNAVAALQSAFADIAFEPTEFRGELTVAVPKQRIVEVCRFLKEQQAFDLLADLCGIDNATSEKRFGVVYNLLSIAKKHRIRLKVFVEESDLHVPTVTGVWGTANWHERETFDMFGIVFDGHPDLRRLYLPDEFAYYPLRKDFPLMGIPGSLPLPKK